jgi:hypothetical protein
MSLFERGGVSLRPAHRYCRCFPAGTSEQKLADCLDTLHTYLAGINVHLFRCYTREGVSIHVDLYDDMTSEQHRLTGLVVLDFHKA